MYTRDELLVQVVKSVYAAKRYNATLVKYPPCAEDADYYAEKASWMSFLIEKGEPLIVELTSSALVSVPDELHAKCVHFVAKANEKYVPVAY